MSTPNDKKVPTTPKLIPSRFKGAEFARNAFRARPEASTELKDVLDPTYWAHVAPNVSLYDVIEVIPEGGAWYAQLLVVGCSKLHVKVSVLLVQKLNVNASEAPKSDAKFVIEFKGPQRKWSVIRVADKAYVKEGFDAKEGAAAWLAENEAELLGLA